MNPLQTVNRTPVPAMIRIQVSFQRMALIDASVWPRSPILPPRLRVFLLFGATHHVDCADDMQIPSITL